MSWTGTTPTPGSAASTLLLAAFVGGHVVVLGAFAAHRILRAIPAVRALPPDWVSWKRKDFPMGLALVGTFVTYMVLMAFPSLYSALLGSINM